MRLAFLVLLALSGAAAAQQPPAADPTPPPIDRSVPNSGTSRSTDDAAKPTEKDGSLLPGSSGSSSTQDQNVSGELNGKDDKPKAPSSDTKPDR
jgi:hypothetical protein